MSVVTFNQTLFLYSFASLCLFFCPVLRRELGHFYKSYKEISELKYLFDQQLNKFIPELIATFTANFQSEKQESDQSLQFQIKQLEQQLEEEKWFDRSNLPSGITIRSVISLVLILAFLFSRINTWNF